MTYEQILCKLTSMCAKRECCLHDVHSKMEKWEIDDDVKEKVTTYLLRERYIDEKRYARYFIKDKLVYNKWGRKKIEQALYLKHIPKDVYASLFEEFSEDDYIDKLLPLLKTKAKSVKGNSDYEIRLKLIRYAMQRGFSYEQAETALCRMQ